MRAQRQLSTNPQHAEDDEPDLDQKRAKIEGADEADQHENGGDDLAGGIKRTIAAGVAGLDKGETTDIYDRSDDTAGLQRVWIHAHQFEKVGEKGQHGVVRVIRPTNRTYRRSGARSEKLCLRWMRPISRHAV